MLPIVVFSVLLVYFLLLLSIAFLTSQKSDSLSFFNANKNAPWPLVAFGMIGTSLSGATFISVPGKVGVSQFTYFQVVLGYVAGYVVVALVLLPVYYKLNLISIYGYLETRFGRITRLTGSTIFLVSRLIGASLRLFLAANVLQLYLFDHYKIPFEIAVLTTIFLIWIYTLKGGIKTIIWTDTLQTLFLLWSLITSIFVIYKSFDSNFDAILTAIRTKGYFKTFVFDDFKSELFFGKQFLGGFFITIAMTGLDQDLMQKNLTCRTLKDAQKNMFVFSIILVIINLLFLFLGALLYLYALENNIQLPKKTDNLYPTLAFHHLGWVAALCFLLGITASSYASADSALTSLTTSFCIDFLKIEQFPEKSIIKIKNLIHLLFSLLLFVGILLFFYTSDYAVIDAILKIATYTYGPLLGLYTFGIFTNYTINESWVPFICFLSPILTILIENFLPWLLNNNYKFGYELLPLNGLLTVLLLYLNSRKLN
jgi:Na+/proline symporter